MSATLKTIPLCQLQRSKTNVRKTDRQADIEQMAASIEANGLLENLVVQKGSGTKNGRYDVVAGGRRLAALRLLVRRKKIESGRPIPCLILEDGALKGLEASLAENTIRAPIHPADQFKAFAKLVSDGHAADEIASRFGVTPTFVHQRLKLAAVSPRLVAEYRTGAMTLEQLTAFTLCDERARQEAIWFESPYSELSAQSIRRLLTRTTVDGTDRRARFIGPEAYEAAGGVIVRDLFDAEDGGYYSNSQLLDHLVAERLDAAAQEVRAEGWNWVEVHAEAEFAFLSGFGRAATAERALSRNDERRLAKLSNQYDELVSTLEDETNEEQGETLDRITAELEALQARKAVWPDAEKARAGAIVTLGRDATITIVRGLVKADSASEADAAGTPRSGRKAVSGGYSEAILQDLSAHRTAALRQVLAVKPEQALLTLLHTLVEQLFHGGRLDNCLAIVPTEIALDRASSTVGDSTATRAFQAQHAAWIARMSKQDDLPIWLSELSQADRLELLGHCVALTVNALHGPLGRGAAASRLADQVALDMTAWWRPTCENFLGRLNKSQILAAVADGVSQEAAHRLRDLKKDRMAAEAERLLGPTGWLPAPLRNAVATAPEQGEQG